MTGFPSYTGKKTNRALKALFVWREGREQELPHWLEKRASVVEGGQLYVRNGGTPESDITVPSGASLGLLEDGKIQRVA